jgi:hypothetical protein
MLSKVDRMRHTTEWLLICALIAGVYAPACADELDQERTQYLSSCANCHGEDGKGKGPFAEKLKRAPPDLTLFAQKNNGVFPVTRIYRSIDGRTLVESHEIREMPVWGCRHAPLAVQQGPVKPDPYESLIDLPCGPQDVIANRILSVLVYLRRIQQK